MSRARTIIRFAILALIKFADSMDLHRSNRIVGGNEAEKLQFPFLASIYSKEKGANLLKVCGGSIVDERWILTAAHCGKGIKETDMVICVGSIYFGKGDHHSVDTIFIHPKYDEKFYDIALIKLQRPIVNLGQRAKKIMLNEDEVRPGGQATIIGWGFKSANNQEIPALRYVQVAIASCQMEDLMDIIFKFTSGYDDSNLVCTSTKDDKGACQGDSGGPLVSDRKQIGVVSRGQPCATGFPDVYTKVSKFVGWIKETMQK